MVSHPYYPPPYPANVYPPPKQEAPATDLLALYYSLDELVKHIEEVLASGRGSGDDSEGSGISGVLELTKEQELTMNMILSSNANWTVAIRKVLVTLFRTETLAGSCAVEVKEKFYNTAIKGLCNLNFDLLLFVTKYLEKRIKESDLNVIINSACAGAKRSLK